MLHTKPLRMTGWRSLLDIALLPIMLVLSGFKPSDIQHTHPWHTYRGFDETTIDPALSVEIYGNDTSRIGKHALFLFHAPIIGGWKRYVVLAPVSGERPFHIGWCVRSAVTGVVLDKGISRLPITAQSVRMLVGPPTQINKFFTVSSAGEQRAVALIGQGTIGDEHYENIPLF